MPVDVPLEDALEPVPDAPVEPHRPARGWVVARAALAVAVCVAVCVAAVVERGAVLTALRALRAPSPLWLIAAIVAEVASMGCYARMQRRLLRGAGTTVPLHRAVALAYAAHSMSITLPGGPLISTVYNYRRMRGFGADSTVAAWCTAASGLLSALGLGALTLAVGLAAAVDGTDDVLPVALLVAALLALAAGGRLLRRRPDLAVALRRTVRTHVGARLPGGARARLAEASCVAGPAPAGAHPAAGPRRGQPVLGGELGGRRAVPGAVLPGAGRVGRPGAAGAHLHRRDDRLQPADRPRGSGHGGRRAGPRPGHRRRPDLARRWPSSCSTG